MEVDKKLYEDIKEYCKLNGLKPSEYINATLKRAFMKDKYGDAPFLQKCGQEFVMYGNKAFEDAVNAEIKRILNDKDEIEKIVEEHRKRFYNGPDESEEAQRKFNETFFHGMKEPQEAEKEISDYMEKNNLEPVSIEELIFDEDDPADNSVSKNDEPAEESRQDVQKNVQIQENVQKSDVNLDKKPKKRTITPKR